MARIVPLAAKPLSATVNGRLLDRSIRHAVALQRYGSHLTREVVAFLNGEVFPDLLGRLTARLERIRSRGYDAGTSTTARYAAMVDDLAAIIDDGTGQVRQQIATAARELAKVEADWQHRAIVSSAPEALAARFGDGVNLRIVQQVVHQPILGGQLAEWFDDLSTSTKANVKRTVTLGLAQGETLDQIVRRVRGTRAAAYSDGVLQGTRRKAEAIVRTVTTHVSTQAREQTFREMSDVVKGVQWVSTLDTRTTPVCQSRDGQVFAIGEGPRPPAHPNCRSTVVPVVRSLREILGKDAKELPESTRASMDGQVPERLTYGDWLAQQPAARQDEALGPTRARMFRAGQLQVSDLVARDGRTLTLEELRDH